MPTVSDEGAVYVAEGAIRSTVSVRLVMPGSNPVAVAVTDTITLVPVT